MFDFSNKVALITGTSYGLGQQFAYGFAEAGADLILTAWSEELSNAVAEKCRAIGPPGRAVPGRVPQLLFQHPAIA